MKDREKWDMRFMRLTDELASWSREKGKRVGAVIIDNENIICSTGFNGFPRGIDDSKDERHDRDSGAKHLWSTHAERNAIYNAARVGIPINGCRIYSSTFPCIECTKAIIQSGIKELITRNPNFNDPRWGEEFRFAQSMLAESNVEITIYKS